MTSGKNKEARREVERELKDIGEPAKLGEVTNGVSMNYRRVQHYLKALSKEGRVEIVETDGMHHYYKLT